MAEAGPSWKPERIPGHDLKPFGEVASTRSDPPGHEGGDRSLWRQIEFVRDLDHSLRQSRDRGAIADDLVSRHRVHASERQAAWISQPFAECDTPIDVVPGFPDAAELRKPQSEDHMGANSWIMSAELRA